MKSLSILILLGTLSAIVLGAAFAITPAFAGNAAPETASQASSLPAAEAVAPVTGSQPEIASAAPVASAQDETQPAPSTDVTSDEAVGEVMASTFTLNIEKDTASAEAMQEANALTEAPAAQQPAPAASSFESFVTSVSNGKANQVTGIYVDGLMAYSVVRQPNGNAAFVSEQPSVVTQFGLASEYGSQAFLAHNYLAGATFAKLEFGDVITLVYGDGHSADFQVSELRRFQALSPDSTQSSFVDLASGEQLSASKLFHSVYNSDGSVVLQTCIAQDGVSTWGRLFITAVPLS
jgi:hypothetical protein